MSFYFEDNSPQAIKEMLFKAEKAMEIIGAKAENYTKGLAPVDTGALRNSYTHVVKADKEEISTTIGTNIEYAPYQEYGTSRTHAQPHLRPAIQNHMDEWEYIIESVMGE